MSEKIAVIMNTDNELTAFDDGSVLLIFNRENESWRVISEIPYSLDITSKIPEIRDNIRTVILQLEDCKIIIGKTVTGLSYNIFERMGFEIFEADTFSEALLTEISDELEAETAVKTPAFSASSTSPVLTSEEGVYFLDLIQLQESHPEISSKRALQSFIEVNPFFRLEVVCSHIPPWFDILLPRKKLTYSVDELEKNKLKVSIIRKVCTC